MKGKYIENPDYIINCYKKGKLVKDIEIQMDEEIFKNQIKEGFLNYLDVNSGEVETINLNQFDYYEILRTKEKKIPEKLIPTTLRDIDNLDEKIDVAHIDTISAIETINEIIDYLDYIKSKGE